MTSNVIPLPVRLTATDFAKVLLQIQAELQGIDDKSDQLSTEQQALMQQALNSCASLSKQHEGLLARRQELMDTMSSMLTNPIILIDTHA